MIPAHAKEYQQKAPIRKNTKRCRRGNWVSLLLSRMLSLGLSHANDCVNSSA